VQLVGIRPRSTFGGPVRVLAGRARPRLGEIVVDAVVAGDLGVGLGDRVGVRSAAVRSAKLTVVGIASGGNNVIGSYAFVSRATLALAGMLQPTHLFVVAAAGRDPAALRATLARLPGVRVLTREEFEARNLAFPRQVFGAMVGVLDGTATLVAAAMIAVVLHARSLAQRADYGLLAALGAPARLRYASAVATALVTTGIGTLLGTVVAAGVTRVVPVLIPRFVSALPASLVAGVVVVALAVALAAAAGPVRRLATVDPAFVLRS